MVLTQTCGERIARKGGGRKGEAEGDRGRGGGGGVAAGGGI